VILTNGTSILGGWNPARLSRLTAEALRVRLCV